LAAFMFMKRAAPLPMVSAFGFNVLTDPMAAVVLLMNWAVLPLLIYRSVLFANSQGKPLKTVALRCLRT
jgi:hypothetical protein